MSDGRKNKSFLHRIIARSKFDVSIDKFNSFLIDEYLSSVSFFVIFLLIKFKNNLFIILLFIYNFGWVVINEFFVSGKASENVLFLMFESILSISSGS